MSTIAIRYEHACMLTDEAFAAEWYMSTIATRYEHACMLTDECTYIGQEAARSPGLYGGPVTSLADVDAAGRKAATTKINQEVRGRHSQGMWGQA
eukprot:11491861-Alexandrium_andersonii.AAC.1